MPGIAAGLDAIHAGVAELVDALDLGSSDESCGGSSPSARTKRFARQGVRRIEYCVNAKQDALEAGVGGLNRFPRRELVRRTPAQGNFGRASNRFDKVPAVKGAGRSRRRLDAMQVTETLNEGLKHEFKISVPASDLDAKADARLVDLKDKVRLNGFRPGKVPVSHLKKVYGRSVMAETIDQTIRDTNTQLFTERGFRLATEPKITMPTEEKEVEEMLSGKSDLTYTVSIEVVPAIALADFKSFKVEKPVAEVSDADIDEAIKRIADQNRGYAAKGEGAKAETGDRVTINFKGTIDGVPFDGGTGENIQVTIGSNTFIPGFEEQLIGIAAGDTRTLKVPFPKNYASEKLAGQPAEFETTATLIEAPQETAINDEFAKTLGLESLDKLKEAARERLAAEFAGATRQRVKRALLDRLDESPSVRGAAVAGRRRIQSDVEFDQGRDGIGRQDLCR